MNERDTAELVAALAERRRTDPIVDEIVQRNVRLVRALELASDKLKAERARHDGYWREPIGKVFGERNTLRVDLAEALALLLMSWRRDDVDAMDYLSRRDALLAKAEAHDGISRGASSGQAGDSKAMEGK